MLLLIYTLGWSVKANRSACFPMGECHLKANQKPTVSRAITILFQLPLSAVSARGPAQVRGGCRMALQGRRQWRQQCVGWLEIQGRHCHSCRNKVLDFGRPLACRRCSGFRTSTCSCACLSVEDFIARLLRESQPNSPLDYCCICLGSIFHARNV